MMQARTAILAAIPLLLAAATSIGTVSAGEESEERRAESKQVETDPEEQGAVVTRPVSAEKEAPVEVPKFNPPKSPAPRARVGGGTRAFIRAELSGIEALVPAQAGLTLDKRPVLSWYVSQELGGRADLSVTSANAIEPLLEVTIDGPFRPGVQRIDLGHHGVSLEPGVTYQWMVAVVPAGARRSEAKEIGGGIERVDPPEDLRSKLEAAGAARAAFVLAEAGIWYDALDSLSKRIDDSPGDAVLRRQRAALFEQVGLVGPAREERSVAGLRPE